VGLPLNLPSRWRHIDSDQEPQSAAASGLSGFVPFPELARFRDMPCGGFAQEFCGGGITHELGDLEAELGLAAMMASIVHAFCSGLYCSCSTRTSKNTCSTAPLCRVQRHRRAMLINQLLEDKPSQ
jgi:hypothetical protein